MSNTDRNTLNPGPVTSDGPITFGDVLAGIGEDDPDTVKLETLRERIGRRGSYSTIRKHLKTIRAEKKEVVAASSRAVVGPPPMDLLISLWDAACVNSDVKLLGKLNDASHERDILASKVRQQEEEIDDLIKAVDSLSEMNGIADLAASTLALQNAETVNQMIETRERVEKELRESLAGLISAEARIDDVKREAKSDADLAAAKFAVERITLNGLIDRLNDDVTRLKALEMFKASSGTSAADLIL